MEKLFLRVTVLIGLIFFILVYKQVSAQTQLTENPSVKQALNFLQQIESETIEEQIRICEIPAPPFKEQARGAFLKKRFIDLGLQNVIVDSVGNVIGEYPGKNDSVALVLSAHLDTVFPESTPIKVKSDGNILRAPGIGDDSRGLAVILAVLRALKEYKIEVQGKLIFAATVGEKGIGNLRGVRHLFSIH